MSDPTFGKTPGTAIIDAKAGTCRCGDSIITGKVRDVMTGTLKTRRWDLPASYEHPESGRRWYTKHRCG